MHFVLILLMSHVLFPPQKCIIFFSVWNEGLSDEAMNRLERQIHNLGDNKYVACVVGSMPKTNNPDFFKRLINVSLVPNRRVHVLCCFVNCPVQM